jgi:hypothetical protein
VGRHSGMVRRTRPESWDSPMGNCTSKFDALASPRNDGWIFVRFAKKRPSGDSVSSPVSKNISLSLLPKSILEAPPSRPTEGRLAIVTDAGRDAVDAAASGAQVIRRAVSVSEQQRAGRTALQRLRQIFDRRHMAGRRVGGGCCVRRSRVVLASVADVKSAEARWPNRA